MPIKSVRLVLFSLLLVLVAGLRTEAQPKWRTYVPANKSFSIELPWNPLYKRLDAHSLMPGTAGPFKGINSIETFDFSMYIDEGRTSFVLRVYDLMDNRSDDDFDKEVDLIMANSIKPNGSLTWNSALINGLHGREYVYLNGKVSLRTLFVSNKHRAFILNFYTEDKKGINRGPVDRVFASFQPK